ncbi:YmaF family protein [Metabacillus idriensis]|uniref:YmaF family protein n=1 Tax=Metabacillus idriensis TaxID=324768 RepID=UPI0028135DAE|nr:YmaF family protein [Metabacillus idriensis]MDR0137456.1 YmaF family protein [Metabacillus idriensis]
MDCYRQQLPVPHAHFYQGVTEYKENHYHYVLGFSKPLNGNSYDKHFHYVEGLTTFDNQHYHRFYVKTGPPIPMLDGTHYHLFSGKTYRNYTEGEPVEFGGVVYSEQQKPVHQHLFNGRTSGPIGY